jgi:hypothetical protein
LRENLDEEHHRRKTLFLFVMLPDTRRYFRHLRLIAAESEKGGERTLTFRPEADVPPPTQQYAGRQGHGRLRPTVAASRLT